ncbi:MAG: hypothetical protein QG641_1904 [Candidatus Poribacteria bacterium]|nr:hypothetical protein [Candidatus Poribacteria bacterium]
MRRGKGIRKWCAVSMRTGILYQFSHDMQANLHHTNQNLHSHRTNAQNTQKAQGIYVFVPLQVQGDHQT